MEHHVHDRSYLHGRLSAAWLDQWDSDEDVWSLSTHQFDPPGHRDAFVGNGYIGQRIAPEGDGSAYVYGSASYLHGLWDAANLIELPRWATLGLHDGETDHVRKLGSYETYTQTLHLDRGVAETTFRWQGPYHALDVHFDVFVSRAERNLGILRMRIVPDDDTELLFFDVLDGQHLERVRGWSTSEGDIMTLGGMLGAHERHLEIATTIVVEGGEPLPDTFRTSQASITRIVRLPVKQGHTYTVTKVVALFTDRDARDPQTAARELVQRAAHTLPDQWVAHEAAWREIWSHRVDVDHPRIQKLINAAQYHIYAQLRDNVPWSIGPVGISGDAWGGRVFWDADQWVFPVTALFQPALARSIVEYRYNTLDGARENAAVDGYEGACIAWESGETGKELVPIPEIHHQRHVNAAVAMAQWQYYLISGDEQYLKEKGWEVIRECARYWASRVTYNEEKDLFELLGIYCPDEYAEIQDNNATTNYSAVWTLQLARRLAERFGEEVPPAWSAIIDKMYLPWDEKHQRYIEFDGFDDSHIVKQADTALLIYPYELPMPEHVKTNIVDYYRSKYPPYKIMMGSAIDGVVDCEVGRPQQAWAALLDLLPHFRTPYLVVSESPANEVLTFVTGLGGFLQLIVAGFAGIRIRNDGLVVHPTLPPDWNRLTLHGIWYGGCSFDLMIEDRGQTVAATNFRGDPSFRLYDRDGREIERLP